MASQDQTRAVITYHKHGTQPPIFVAGTFSNPPWEPQEMEYTTREDGEHEFRKEIYGQTGSKIQFKFRVGNGNWWVLNEDSPTITDNSGNTNNEMEIQAEAKPGAPVPESGVKPEAQDQKQDQKPAGIANGNAKKANGNASSAANPAKSRLQAVADDTSSGPRSGAGTPTFVKTAAEVADSAQLLHEGVPDRVQSHPSKSRLQALVDDNSSAPSSGASTPTFVKTAAEVADSAELLHEGVPDREKSHLNKSRLQAVIDDTGSAPRSGAGTPGFVRTAAEVADSAELLHEEVPDREKPEVEHSGIRELNPTPIPEAANTAGEVADTAQTLDNVEAILVQEHGPSNETGSGAPDEESLGFQDGYIDQKTPLFQHECVGLYDDDTEAVQEAEVGAQSDGAQDERCESKSPVRDIDADNIDPNDPTLEPFPLDRQEIMNTVRELETGLEEDQASFDGAAPSPVIDPTRRASQDITGDYELGPPVPVIPHAPKHLDVPRSPRVSNSSPASLESISETEELDGGLERTIPPTIVFTNLDINPRETSLKAHSSDEDEGVSFREAVSPKTVKPRPQRLSSPEDKKGPGQPSAAPEASGSASHQVDESQSQPSGEPGASSSSHPADADTKGRPSDPSEATGSTNAPQEDGALPTPQQEQEPAVPKSSLVENGRAESVKGAVEEDRRVEEVNGGAAPSSPPVENSDADADDTARATGIDDAEPSTQVRRRRASQGEAAEATGRPAPGLQPSKEGGWFKAFFKLLFVDWIGGFLSRLCGGRRKT